MSRNLTVAEVARLRGTSRQAAWEWLRRNARTSLVREGRNVKIPQKSYAAIVGSRIDHLEARLTALEDSEKERDRRLDAHARALANLHAL